MVDGFRASFASTTTLGPFFCQRLNEPAARSRPRQRKDSEDEENACLPRALLCAVHARLLRPRPRKTCKTASTPPRLCWTRSWRAQDQQHPHEHPASRPLAWAWCPGLIKGAFVFGAQYGQGVVTCRTGHGWSAPVFIRMAGGSWGLQIGGQSTDLVLIAVNDHGFQDLLKNKFKIGGDAAAAAGPGRPQHPGSHRLEDERRTAHLLAQQGTVRRNQPGRHRGEPEPGRYRDLLRPPPQLSRRS